MRSNTEGEVRLPSGVAVALSPAEQRLALLGLVDYEAAWDGLIRATDFVADGAAKRKIIENRILSLADALTSLTERLDSLDLLAARHWFRYEPIAPAGAAPEEPVG